MKIALQRSGNPRVSFIIPSSIRTDLLYGCLRSLVRFGPRELPYETIVVLNQADASAEAKLRETVFGVEFISSPVNLGLAGAGNRGRSLARGEFLLLLHDDAEVLPGWMEALVETADSHPEAGAIGSKVLFPDGRLQNVGMIMWRNATTSTPWVGDAPPPSAFDRLLIVDQCGTSSLLVRASAWDMIGGLDEQFYPAYYVDVNLSISLHQAGYVVLCQPNSQILHHRNSSTNPRFRQFFFIRNRELFLEKWAAALEQYEPFETDSKAAIERGMARARAFAERCRTGRTATTRSAQPRPFDSALQEREHFAKSVALQKAYSEHLGNVIDEVEADRARLRELLARSEAMVTSLSRQNQELEQVHGRLSRQHQELEQTHGTLSRQHRELEQAHKAVVRSRFWRMTAPLRYVARLLKIPLR